jgi:DNA-directed RNA polymerase subunit RPC12/RpoP
MERPKANENKKWDSVHKCSQCEHEINLGEIDLMMVTTGMIDCPVCGWTGPIEIHIVERKMTTV